jgi:hypothetical protein
VESKSVKSHQLHFSVYVTNSTAQYSYKKTENQIQIACLNWSSQLQASGQKVIINNIWLAVQEQHSLLRKSLSARGF